MLKKANFLHSAHSVDNGQWTVDSGHLRHQTEGQSKTSLRRGWTLFIRALQSWFSWWDNPNPNQNDQLMSESNIMLEKLNAIKQGK